MKKVFMILTLLFSVVAGAMAQNNAMYVYRNDGEFNAFLKSDVDSMRYSHLDADSVFHDDWQMQEFFTADSVYRIPLAAIDSVSFVTPSMEYKSDVMLVEDNLLKYLIAHTDKTLTFSLNVPTGLLPSVGDVVVFDKYEEPIPEGFYGRYVSRKSTSDGIECLFEEVGLEEIYNHLVVVGQVGSYNEDDNENSQRRIFTVGNNKRVCLPLKVPLSVSIKDIVHGVDIFGSNAKRAVDINGSIGITLDRPQLTINYIICIGERNLKNQVMLKARFYSEGEASVSGNLAGNYSPEPMWFPGCQWPFNFYGIAGEFDLGLYFEANGEINASYSVPIVIDVTRGFSIKEGEWPYFYEGNGSCANRDKAEWDLNLNGSLSAGLAGRLSVGLVNKKVASLDVTLKAGPEVSANFKIADKESGFNSNLYDALKNTEVTASLRLQADAGYRIWFKDRESFDHPLNVHLFKTTRPILPTIENVKWTPSGLCSGTLTADVSRDTFTSVSLGWTLRDKNNEVYMKEFYDEKYQFNANWPYVNLPLNLSDLPANYNYKAYPTVKLWKWEIPINEYAEVVSKGCPAHVTDFKVTKSYHKDGAYTNDGRSYDYKFDAATTVELDPEIVRDLNGDGWISAADLSGIDDWGYAYEDPNGKTTHISLKNFSSPYTDTRYAYYRNEPSSSVRLYGYVRYSGDGEYYYDEPQDFTLKHEEEDNTLLCDSTITYNADGSFLSKTSFTYDKNGKLVCSVAYVYENGHWILHNKTERAYDKNDNVISVINYDWKSGRWIRVLSGEWEFDENGNIIDHATYVLRNDQWVGNSRWGYSYDKNGNETTFYAYNWEEGQWVLIGYTEKDYNEHGNILSEWWYQQIDGTWQLRAKIEYSYDKNDNEMSSVVWDYVDKQWIQYSKDEYTYDENRNRTSYINYLWEDNKWNYTKKYEYFYDDNNNLTSSTSYIWDNNQWVGSTKSESTYDQNGNITNANNYKWENNQWLNVSKWEMHYNENGNEVDTSSYYWQNGNWVGDTRYETVYDENGNRTASFYYLWQNSQWQLDRYDEYFYSIHRCKDLDTKSRALRYKNPRMENCITGLKAIPPYDYQDLPFSIHPQTPHRL